MESNEITDKSLKSFTAPLFAGATAGVTVSAALYPLDTLKTRLQSPQGFYKAGGFNGVYRGLLTVVAGSMPTTALFFATYEAIKNVASPMMAPQYLPLVHMMAASVGEVLTCLIRVPIEIAKQRKQTYVGNQAKSSIGILVHAFRTGGLRNGVYRGFLPTLMRDLPIGFIEMPLWELFKKIVKERNDGNISSVESACCGSIAGCVAAVATTPLDLAKTRIMLADDHAATRKLRIAPVLTHIFAESGFRGLFAGVIPRISLFMIGGFAFFGAYETSKDIFERYFHR
ncbi:S-adenosylmethionine mitochondrial carrier protein-like [Leptidea sinapis]|uniref:S-adenosylmethionine mitochondrial carrier protein n=1 Tax=Leptidea sinapis TaxID=189913 RepID=A0A5E4Q7B7_9NEOP|nr:S-adenosylmethionine mitochondrial carrier protein-like [Leptidea sinapis]VVC93462.1 unnamed protein product [Leptidea sinapis]